MRDGHLHLLQKSWGMATSAFLRRDGDGHLPFLRRDGEGHLHLPYKRDYIIISAYHLIIILIRIHSYLRRDGDGYLTPLRRAGDGLLHIPSEELGDGHLYLP